MSRKPKSSSRNSALLKSFVAYCILHPEERFWQALRNWAGADFICTSALPPMYFEQPKVYDRLDQLIPMELRDTFYWEGRDG